MSSQISRPTRSGGSTPPGLRFPIRSGTFISIRRPGTKKGRRPCNKPEPSCEDPCREHPSRIGDLTGRPQTDQEDTVQGQVDQATQRVAFRIGDSEDVVVETGLYNLTLQDVPILVQFGPEKTENWLLARLEASEEDADDA